MIYLNPEVRSGLGEDTFWTWFARSVPNSSFDLPDRMQPDDVLLQYGTLGPSRIKGGRTVALLWELYPEMARAGVPVNQGRIDAMAACAAGSDVSVVTSELMLEYYPRASVLPIGVDTEVFKPMTLIRREWGLPADKRIGFWCGTKDWMKGFDRVRRFAEANPDVHMVCVWKKANKADHLDGHSNFTQVSQRQMAKLMNCCEFALFTGRLRPYFMVEWEAMACDLEIVDVSGCKREFEPGEHPRNAVIKRGWSRPDALRAWLNFLQVKEACAA